VRAEIGVAHEIFRHDGGFFKWKIAVQGSRPGRRAGRGGGPGPPFFACHNGNGYIVYGYIAIP